MKYLLICLLSLLLAGCATTMEYGHEVGSWIGHRVDDLYTKLGRPSSTEPQPDGGKVVSYERKEAVPAPSDVKSAPQQITNNSSAANLAGGAMADQPRTSGSIPPANTRKVSCTTRYKADSSGVIRSWTIDGEGCKANEETHAPPVTGSAAK